MGDLDTSDFLVAFLSGFAYAALLALWGFLRQWRTRDKQLAALGALAALERSPALGDPERELLAARIRMLTDDYLYGDAARRARVVQQTVYWALAVAAIGLFVVGDVTGGLARYVAFAAALGLLVLGVGITGVPASRWRMPAFLRSYRDPASRPAPSSPLVEQAVTDVGLSADQDVLVFACGEGRHLVAARSVVGDGGTVVGVDVDVDKVHWARNVIELNRWGNVQAHAPNLDSPPDEPMVDAVLVGHRILDLQPAELVKALGWMHGALRPGGRLFALAWTSRLKRRGSSPEQLFALIRERFDAVGYAELRGSGMAIRGTRRD